MTLFHSYSLLQDKEMMTSDNLVLDPMNPLAMYKPKNGRLGEALVSGSVYQKMYDEYVTDLPGNFFVL